MSLALLLCAACATFLGGPPSEFWRSEDHPTLAWSGPDAEKPIGTVRLLRHEEPAIQNMPRISYAPPIAWFRWTEDGSVVRYAYRGVDPKDDGAQRARWERVD